MFNDVVFNMESVSIRKSSLSEEDPHDEEYPFVV